MPRETPGIYRITDLSASDRPRERLAELGSQALTNAELIAILLRVGIEGENAVQMGQRLLQDLGGLHGLHRATVLEISQQHGMGLAKAAQIKAAIELGLRLRLESPDELPAIHSPADAAALVGNCSSLLYSATRHRSLCCITIPVATRPPALKMWR